MEKSKILVVEDDRSLREALRHNLAAEGYEVLVDNDGRSALKAIRTIRPDVVILDVGLPSMSGIEICETLKNEGSLLPVILLTAKTDIEDRINGLNAGAVDYVTKPFSTDELLARVAAQTRRSELNQTVFTADPKDEIDFGELTIDLAARTAKVRDKTIELKLREFDLLVFLASNPGRVYSRDVLLSRVWEPEYSGTPRTVDVHIRWLRSKIELDPSDPKLLQTVRGIGYKFDLT